MPILKPEQAEILKKDLQEIHSLYRPLKNKVDLFVSHVATYDDQHEVILSEIEFQDMLSAVGEALTECMNEIVSDQVERD